MKEKTCRAKLKPLPNGKLLVVCRDCGFNNQIADEEGAIKFLKAQTCNETLCPGGRPFPSEIPLTTKKGQ
jgi:hypothetical protein